MNSDYRDFVRLAYRKAILEAVQRHVQDHISKDVSMLPALCADEVFFADREVTEDALHDYLDEVREEIADLVMKMRLFEVRKKDPNEKKSQESEAEGSGNG